ncbi:unnamed protein product [Protopolystoma xenopodis]|uniref:Uncharacterized protein n=1 Tax=Protopolystoma xenopodis TaxID=117903 RepID=A0A448WM75_9PLAT|nr:unnamed protein product [Protopolystoma xenopodis]
MIRLHWIGVFRSLFEYCVSSRNGSLLLASDQFPLDGVSWSWPPTPRGRSSAPIDQGRWKVQLAPPSLTGRGWKPRDNPTLDDVNLLAEAHFAEDSRKQNIKSPPTLSVATKRCVSESGQQFGSAVDMSVWRMPLDREFEVRLPNPPTKDGPGLLRSVNVHKGPSRPDWTELYASTHPGIRVHLVRIS